MSIVVQDAYIHNTGGDPVGYAKILVDPEREIFAGCNFKFCEIQLRSKPPNPVFSSCIFENCILRDLPFEAFTNCYFKGENEGPSWRIKPPTTESGQ